MDSKTKRFFSTIQSSLLSANELPLMFIRFYSVGLLLFILPFTRDFFISVIWISLLLVMAMVFYHHKLWNISFISLSLFIIISSFFLEMAGIATGEIFGNYRYERGLGPQINGTPLIIGLNWLWLVYGSHDIANRIISKTLLPLPVRIAGRIITGALLMIIYDIVLEWIAPAMQMWRFSEDYPPLQNFITWFIAAIIYHCCFELFNIHTNNRPARMLFWIQILFFIAIGLYSHFIIS